MGSLDRTSRPENLGSGRACTSGRARACILGLTVEPSRARACGKQNFGQARTGPVGLWSGRTRLGYDFCGPMVGPGRTRDCVSRVGLFSLGPARLLARYSPPSRLAPHPIPAATSVTCLKWYHMFPATSEKMYRPSRSKVSVLIYLDDILLDPPMHFTYRFERGR